MTQPPSGGPDRGPTGPNGGSPSHDPEARPDPGEGQPPLPPAPPEGAGSAPPPSVPRHPFGSSAPPGAAGPGHHPGPPPSGPQRQSAPPGGMPPASPQQFGAPGPQAAGQPGAPEAGYPGHPGHSSNPGQQGDPAQGGPGGQPGDPMSGDADVPPVESAPKQNRGCAVTMIAGLAVVVLALLAGGVWTVVVLSGAGGDYEHAPTCAVARGEALNRLVPDRTTEVDQEIKNLEGTGREGNECRWATAEDGGHVPAAARLVLVSNAGDVELDAEEQATAALKEAAAEYGASKLADLGDGAYSWSDRAGGYEWGCVGVRVSNVYAETCYTAATDFNVGESIDEAEAVAGAEELARDVVQGIKDSKDEE
ncbi:hypothetical protein GCM10009799_34810 [Nocardiopsis rhodophaea]|uniref:Uncharacterized protein n=1 Tax=Nocardiopsis rhodophaea TaxID=280238 RepID=A0ABN2TDS0_9ACTN